MEAEFIITFTVLSALIGWLVSIVIPLAQKAALWDKQDRHEVEPRISRLNWENEEMLRDIDKILKGDQYVIGVWSDRIGKMQREKEQISKFRNSFNQS